MKPLYYIIAFFFYWSFFINAHQEFYKRSANNQCELTNVTATYNNGSFITWQAYNNIAIAANWTQDFPSELNVFTVGDQFNNAVSNWNLFTGKSLFLLQTSIGYNVRVTFIHDYNIFPLAGGIQYGKTYHKFEPISGKDYYLIYSSYCIDYGNYTSIFLNNTTGKNFNWRTDHYIPSASAMDFEYAVSHELGHVLGL